jgi:serine/threonine protein kinase
MGVEAIARLEHPHIVRILRAGRQGDYFFGVLEYIDGGNLKQRLQAQAFSPRAAAQLVGTLARTLHVIHAQGIIHRDLKTSNVLMTVDGVPKIADFGIARAAALHDGDTLSGEILGTPNYMAPEQASGRIAQIGPSTDVYALGAILYELLVGRPPFEGESRFETLHSVVHALPTPPSSRRPGVPANLDAICMKCLAKTPAERYASASELAEDLDRFLTDRPVLARPATRLERAALWLRRRRSRLGAMWKGNGGNVAGSLAGPSKALSATPGDPTIGASAGQSTFVGGVRQERSQASEERGPLTEIRRLAESALDEAEQALYLSRLTWAQKELEAGNIDAAREWLTRCLPHLARPDRRGPEWSEVWKRCGE